jgi:hypothetical protein
MTPLYKPQRYPVLHPGDTINVYLCPSATGGLPVAFDRNGRVILLDLSPSNENFKAGQYVKLLITKDLGTYYKSRVLGLAEDTTPEPIPLQEPPIASPPEDSEPIPTSTRQPDLASLFEPEPEPASTPAPAPTPTLTPLQEPSPKVLFEDKPARIYIRDGSKKQGIVIYIRYNDSKKLIKSLLPYHLRRVKVTAVLE